MENAAALDSVINEDKPGTTNEKNTINTDSAHCTIDNDKNMNTQDSSSGRNSVKRSYEDQHIDDVYQKRIRDLEKTGVSLIPKNKEPDKNRSMGDIREPLDLEKLGVSLIPKDKEPDKNNSMSGTREPLDLEKTGVSLISKGKEPDKNNTSSTRETLNLEKTGVSLIPKDKEPDKNNSMSDTRETLNLEKTDVSLIPKGKEPDKNNSMSDTREPLDLEKTGVSLIPKGKEPDKNSSMSDTREPLDLEKTDVSLIPKDKEPDKNNSMSNTREPLDLEKTGVSLIPKDKEPDKNNSMSETREPLDLEKTGVSLIPKDKEPDKNSSMSDTREPLDLEETGVSLIPKDKELDKNNSMSDTREPLDLEKTGVSLLPKDKEPDKNSSMSGTREPLDTIKIVLESMHLVTDTDEYDNTECVNVNSSNVPDNSNSQKGYDVDDFNKTLTEDPFSMTKTGEESNQNGTNSLTDGTPRKSEEIIIDLDDDSINLSDDESCKRKKGLSLRKTCCNFECESRENLKNAPAFVLTYYQVKYVKGKPQKLCKDCFEVAVRHNEHLAYVLSEHKPLLSVKFPNRTDTVVIQDSDEEDSDEDSPLCASVIMDIEEKLMEVIDSTQENYDLEYQMEESKTFLDKTLKDLEVSYKEIDDLFNTLQKTIDSHRAELYNEYAAPIQHLPPLTIVDSDTSMQPPYETYRTASSYLYPPNRRSSAISPASSFNSTRRSPISVATKKVTQVQRPVVAGAPQPEVSREAVEVLEHVEAARQPMLPPIGTLVRPRPQVGDMMYVMKHGYYGMWSRAKVLEVVPKGPEGGHNTFKIKFEYRKSNPVKQVNGRQMAYIQVCPVRFPVGTRVIALFRDEWAKECYYAGVIAEPPKSTNKYRYLVFFDDGYAQYVAHDKILLVCESSRNVWEDIHPESRDFVKNYLEQYPERPMVKLQRDQIVKTEWNGKWWIARVVEVDGSLVKMHFDADARTEWIYRGSTRLGPLFSELAQAAARKSQGTFSRHRSLGIASLKKRNMPYVEYTRTDLDDLKADDSGVGGDASKQYSIPVRAVAKKSTTKRPDSIPDMKADGLIVSERSQQPTGKVEYFQVNTTLGPKKFRPHQCGQSCIMNVPYKPQEMKSYNPLVVPLLCGWQRHIGRYRGKRVVLYKAPCGRRLRNLEELHRYLRVTRSLMSVDQFDFDFWVHCFAEFILDDVKIFTNIKDLSYGAENVPVPCVNYVDHSMPDYVNYSTVRIPMEGVNLNVQPEFLTSCDCVDDCQDKDKCACWQLTIQGAAYGQGNLMDNSTVGYMYKRLADPVMTGIYECNSQCKCSRTCLNRVAQHPLQLRLQVFKTENRGWGIRCLNDIAQGSFICIYAGCLLTEQGANEGGKNYGDEYLAELDYIEVVERLKEGYESDVVEDEDCEDKVRDKDEINKTLKAPDVVPPESLMGDDSDLSEEEEEGEMSQDARDSDEDFELNKRQMMLSLKLADESSIRTRLRKRTSRNGSDDSLEKEKEKDFDKDLEKESEKSSSSEEKEAKKLDGVKKPSRTNSNDEYIVVSDDDDDGGCREPSRFSAVAEPKKELESKPKHRSVREFFGAEECCYIMDAKTNGNIGRYLNHSCSPNVFVQNVFVDTHDLRFPWVAFFALTYIRAGTELTWDYNYDVGSVPGKVMHCYCGSTDCRGRLL